MPSPHLIERSKPLLGTFVRIRVEGLLPGAARAATSEAFAEISRIHDLMSFHAADSDVSRLNRRAVKEAVPVDACTFHVLERALAFAARSGGAFDPTVGGALVARGLLLAPFSAVPAPGGDWRAVELLSDNRVRFHRPLWLDLGGIAKGYAVDRAMAVLAAHKPAQACVNAGGDLRVMGGRAERTLLVAEPDTAPGDSKTMIPVVEVRDESIASSLGAMRVRGRGMPHVATRQAHSHPRRFVSVIAPLCLEADALTKVAMALGGKAASLLAAYGAHALLCDASGWREIGGRA